MAELTAVARLECEENLVVIFRARDVIAFAADDDSSSSTQR